jgi:hypothetical protein
VPTSGNRLSPKYSSKYSEQHLTHSLLGVSLIVVSSMLYPLIMHPSNPLSTVTVSRFIPLDTCTAVPLSAVTLARPSPLNYCTAPAKEVTLLMLCWVGTTQLTVHGLKGAPCLALKGQSFWTPFKPGGPERPLKSKQEPDDWLLNNRSWPQKQCQSCVTIIAEHATPAVYGLGCSLLAQRQ